MQRDELFAAEIYDQVTERAVRIVEQLSSVDLAQIKNDRWRAVASLVQAIRPDQREAVLELVIQASVDAAASVFAVVQGSHALESFDEDMRLLHGTEDVGRNILTYFLAHDEHARPWVLGRTS